MYLFIQAALGLSCGTRDLRCSMQDLLVVACGLQLRHVDSQSRNADSYLQHACGIQFPDQRLDPGPLHWECVVLPIGPPIFSRVPIFSFLTLHKRCVIISASLIHLSQTPSLFPCSNYHPLTTKATVGLFYLQ